MVDDPRQMLAQEALDFVDCITDVDTHLQFVQMAAEQRLPVICQKPLGPSPAVAREMSAACRRAGVPLLVHENWRCAGLCGGVGQMIPDADVPTASRQFWIAGDEGRRIP